MNKSIKRFLEYVLIFLQENQHIFNPHEMLYDMFLHPVGCVSVICLLSVTEAHQ